MRKMRLAILLFLFIQSLPIKSAQAQPPIYSLDGDTVHWGNLAAVKATGPALSDGPPALLGTAESGIIATTWGPEIRLTYWGDSSTVGYPHQCISGDTVFITSGRSMRSGRFLPILIKSLNGGDIWSEPWYIPDNDTASVESEMFIRYHAGRLNVCGKISGNSQFLFYNYQAKYSIDQGVSWTLPHFFYPEDQRLIGFASGVSSGDTILFAFLRVTGHSDYSNIDSIETAVSYNNGTSWSSPEAAVYDTDNNYWSSSAQSQGRVHLLFQDRSSRSHLTEIYHSFSSDWGATWSNPRVISDDILTHSSWPGLSASSEGRLVASWYDFKYGDGGGGFTGDILYRVSLDNGDSWGPESRLTQNHNATASQSFIVGEKIGIVWEDHRDGFFQPDLFYAESSDLGETWSDEIRLTNASGESHSARLAYQDGSLILTWLDARNAPMFGDDVYFRRADEVVGIRETEGNIPGKVGLTAYPNPFNSTTTLTLGNADNAEIVIFDITGRRIATLHAYNGKAVWDATGLSSGLYFARAEIGKTAENIKLILLK